MRALEAEVAGWTARERELLHELAAIRTTPPGAAELPPEGTGLAEGELRDAFTAARTGGRRRPRWADDLLGGREPED
ncbi:MAG: hypothetical protein QOD76_1309 [Solirubrobacteraceae bacterium]|nr:hypothetical protein [Solirubrobacteraceae bacterium]